MSTRGASACVGNTPTGLPDCTSKVSSSVKVFKVSTMRSKQFQSRAARPMPPYTTSSAGFSATSGSRLFISMRNGASVNQERALRVVPRGARMRRGFTGASMVSLLEAERGPEAPRHFIAGAGMVEARERGDGAMGPGAAGHEQARLVALHGQELARSLVRHHGAQHVLRLLQRRYMDQVVVGRCPAEVHVEVAGRERRRDVAVLELHRPVILEMHDQRAVQLATGRHAEVCGELGVGAHALEAHDLGAVHMAALADFLVDAANLERMRAGMAVGDEAADAGDAHQNALIAQLLERAIGGHARYAEFLDDVVLGRDARGDGPFAGADVLQNVALDLEVQRLQGGACLGAHGSKRNLYRQVQSTAGKCGSRRHAAAPRMTTFPKS